MAKQKSVPSQKKINRLPRWAQVAFAARCARRVAPLFVAAWQEAPKKQVEAVENAIVIAEQTAAKGINEATDAIYATASAIDDAAYAASSAARAAKVINKTAYSVAYSAAWAAKSACAAVYINNFAAYYAAKAASNAKTADTNETNISGICCDFDFLIKLAKENNWDNTTPVSPKIFGPLWYTIAKEHKYKGDITVSEFKKDFSEMASSLPVRKEPEGHIYPVWYATNRKHVDSNDLSKGYSNDREKINVVHYGKCDVYIPKYHKIGSLGSSWFKQLFTGRDEPLSILDRKTLPESDYWKNIRAVIDKLERGERTALVFIHGYNISFDEAALRAAQLGVDLKIPLTAFYSWPSKGELFDYAADVASVEVSEPYIENFLIKFAKNSGADSINIIAHSMGNRGLLRAVQNAEAEVIVPFNQIFLAAPDIDSDTFQQIADKYHNISKRTTLYCSSKDKALELSGELYKYPRAGHIPPVTIVNGIDTIEASLVDFSRLGHEYYAAARSVLQDMHEAIIHNTPPENRFGLWRVKTTKGVYWTFEP